jgi:hypothetical protein
MVTTSTLELTWTDGRNQSIKIEPLFFQEDGQTFYTGAYQLHTRTPHDAATDYLRVDADENLNIGTFAHKRDDKYEWAYMGEFLDDDEQSHVAAHIQNIASIKES